MVRVGHMVRLSGGRMMRVTCVFSDFAQCVFVDAEGRIKQRWFMADDLSPWWLSAGPRCMWPDVTDLPDDLSIAPTKRKKPKQSKKLKRAAA